MPSEIDRTSPPVDGPFIMVWLGIDATPGAQWTRYDDVLMTEAEAVRAWQNACLYDNMRPVSISPEPRWNRYTFDWRTPVTR